MSFNQFISQHSFKLTARNESIKSCKLIIILQSVIKYKETMNVYEKSHFLQFRDLKERAGLN